MPCVRIVLGLRMFVRNVNFLQKCYQGTIVTIVNVMSSANKTPQELQLEIQEEERVLGGMSERQRRSYIRKMNRGDVDEANELAEKVDDGGWSDNDDEDIKVTDEEEKFQWEPDGTSERTHGRQAQQNPESF